MFSGRMKSANVLLSGSERTDLSLSSVKNNGIAGNRNRCYLSRSVNRNLNSSILFAFYVFICFFFLLVFAHSFAHLQLGPHCGTYGTCAYSLSFSEPEKQCSFNERNWKPLIRLFLDSAKEFHYTKRHYGNQHRKRTERDTHKFCEIYKLFKWFILPFTHVPNDVLRASASYCFFLPYEILWCALARNEYPKDPPF